MRGSAGLSRFRDYLYVGLLALYLLAGCALVPLHGDEPTVIYTSWDFDAIRRGDWAHLVYQDPPPADDPQAATRQDLRLLNGVINRYWVGLLWNTAGMTTRDLNDQWLWGADLAFNRANNHLPSDQLLFLSRFGSGLLAVLSVAVIFVIGKRTGGRRTAWLASLIYTLTPALLLNSRRAMMESGFLLCSALLLYAGLWFVEKPNIRRLVLLGIAAGLAFASKHTGLLTVAAVFGGIGLFSLIRAGLSGTIIAATKLGGAFILMLAVFFVLNPVWWSDPLPMPGRILSARAALLKGQTEAFGGYTDTGERAAGLIREMFAAPPQYYEVKEGWSVWLADAIKTYEGNLLSGVSNLAFSTLIGALFLVGCWRALRHWHEPTSFVLLVFAVLSIAAIFVATPVNWQRYYLPLVAPVALLAGMGVSRQIRTANTHQVINKSMVEKYAP
jgi:hypothetical protein